MNPWDQIKKQLEASLSRENYTGVIGKTSYAELELKEQITNMTRYIEPLMIVVMGLIIGGVALALLLPIFTISKVMSQ